MKIELRNLAKHYATYRAVEDLSIDLGEGEMVALLGPSGCGKTTTLRMVAGFIQPTSGSVLFANSDVTQLPAHKRDTGLVFQNYALFPHLTVKDNIAFGLRRRKVSLGQQNERIAAIIDKLRLEGLEDRFPRQLSGGQQQRVAVARALVINPAILLLDEPFSNLDAKLRESTGLEMRRLQRDLGLTSIFVTHDQVEAMSIADRIAVMNRGRVEQIGTAAEIYERPATRFVADFIGSANFLKVKVVSAAADHTVIQLPGSESVSMTAQGAFTPSTHATAMVRPEHIKLLTEVDDASNSQEIEVEAISYQGPFVRILGRMSTGDPLIIQAANTDAGALHPGARQKIRICSNHIRLFSS